jgi:hypothetical protein
MCDFENQEKVLIHMGWRARWDLNPGFSAPEADALIRARLRAHEVETKHALLI